MHRIHTFATLPLLLLVAGKVFATDELVSITTTVSYVSGTTIYLSAGRDAGLERGDSVHIYTQGRYRGITVIYAVSASSSATRPPDSSLQAATGDSAVVVKLRPTIAPSSLLATRREKGSEKTSATRTLVHGRIAAQLAASRSEEGGWDLLQPSILMRVDVSGMLQSDLTLSFFGRTARDFSHRAYPGSQGTTVRLYDLSLRYGSPQGWFGIGIGRMTSRNVGGLGAFDGGELSVRAGRFTVGLIGGGQPDYRTSSVDPDRRKFAGYINYRFSEEGWSRNDVTLAYGRQYFHGNLDRDFLYLQTSLSPAPRLYLYQSTEVDLHDLADGESTQELHVTNTFLTLSWMPTEWLSTSAGYDAARPIVLLESMKAIADTLLDRDLQQGMRASASVRLPLRITASMTGGLRLRTDGARQAHSFGGGIRAADLGGTGVTAGVQFLRTRALYSEGNDLTVTIETWVERWITASLRYNRYAYVLTGRQEGAVATTLSIATSVRMAGSWFALANLDRVWDPGRTGYRMLGELSYHF